MRMRSLFSLTVSIVPWDADTAKLTRWPDGDTDSYRRGPLLASQVAGIPSAHGHKPRPVMCRVM